MRAALLGTFRAFFRWVTFRLLPGQYANREVRQPFASAATAESDSSRAPASAAAAPDPLSASSDPRREPLFSSSSGAIKVFRHLGHTYVKKVGSLTNRDFDAYRAVLDRFGEADKKGDFVFRISDESAFLSALTERGIPFVRWEPEHGLAPEQFDAWLLLLCQAQGHPTGALVEARQDYLAAQFRRGPRCLREHIRALEDAGLLRREKNGQRIRLFPAGDAPPMNRIPRSATSGSPDPQQADPQIRPRSSSADLSQDLFRTRETSGPASTTSATAPAAPGSSPTPTASSAQAMDLTFTSANTTTARSGSSPTPAPSPSPASDPLPVSGSTTSATAPAAPGSSPTPAASSAKAMDLTFAGASITTAGSGSSPTPAASPSSASDPLPVSADFVATGQSSTPAPAAPSVDASAVTSELCYIPDADPGPSARGRRRRPTRQGPEIAAADLPHLLWPGIRAKLKSENQLPALLFFDLLRFCGVGAGGALRVTAAPDKLPKLASNTKLVKAVLVAAAQLAGGGWHIEWVDPSLMRMDSNLSAEGVTHAA